MPISIFDSKRRLAVLRRLEASDLIEPGSSRSAAFEEELASLPA